MEHDETAQIGTDAAAFEAFYRAHLEAVLGFVARRVGDPHEAADLTADIFVAAIESAGRYRPDRGSPRGWLYGIARNALADRRRQQARELRAVSRLSGRRLLDPASVERINERLDAERAARRVHRLLEQLPAGEQAVLELVSLDGLSTVDAAQVLGIPAGTARVRLHRARRRFTRLLAATGGGEHDYQEVLS